MLLHIQQAAMSPITRVEFLALQQQRVLVSFDLSSTVRNIGETLLLVDNQVVHDLQPFRFRLIAQVLWEVHVGSSIVHVHMQITAYPMAKAVLPPIKRLKRNL